MNNLNLSLCSSSSVSSRLRNKSISPQKNDHFFSKKQLNMYSKCSISGILTHRNQSKQHCTEQDSIFRPKLPTKLPIKNNIQQSQSLIKISDQQFVKTASKNGRVASFVEQVVTDPSILHKLIDYKLLAQHYKSKISQQSKNIEEKRKLLQEQHERYYELFGNYHKNYKNRRSQMHAKQTKYEKITQQIKEIQKQRKQIIYQQSILGQMHSHKQQIIDKNIQQLKQKIKNIRKQHLLLQAKYNNMNSQQNKQNTENKRRLIYRQKQLVKLRNKNQALSSIQERIQKIKISKETKRIQYEQLKRTQMNQLKNYKDNMINKSNDQKQLKKKSEKKLTQFVNELLKIIQQNKNNKFAQFAKSYDVTLNSVDYIKQGVRRKNSTSDSISKSIQTNFPIQENQLINKLVNQNPGLKYSDEHFRSLKTVQDPDVYIQRMLNCNMNSIEQKQNYDKQVEVKNLRIQQLNREQGQLSIFIQQLTQRAHKKNMQLQKSQKQGLLLRKSTSLMF